MPLPPDEEQLAQLKQKAKDELGCAPSNINHMPCQMSVWQVWCADKPEVRKYYLRDASRWYSSADVAAQIDQANKDLAIANQRKAQMASAGAAPGAMCMVPSQP
jgi:hypothetical protein